MGYQVTARKWRPQTFDDVIEQHHVTRTLKNAIRFDRVAHAYLFAGTRGVGKTTLARVLAKALNCEQGPTEQPCDTCQSCLEITQGTSLDVVEVDGASNRGIDEIRDLRERLRYLPVRGRYKIYIIDEVHMLTKEAFNALLKTLEEPPAHVVFVFATTELEKIPYTIVSRCQRFEFKRVSLAGIVNRLDSIVQREGITISRSSLLRIAKAAEGSMRDAQSLLDQIIAYCGMEVHDDEVGQILGHVGNETLVQCLEALLQQDAATALQVIDLLQSEGHEALGIARALQESLRHLMVLKTTRQPEQLIPLSEADLAALRTLAETATVEEIYGLFQVLSSAENSLRHASSAFLVLEMTLVRMACIGRVQPLQTILEQLQQLGAETSTPVPTPVSDTVPSTPTRRLTNSQVENLSRERIARPEAPPVVSTGLTRQAPAAPLSEESAAQAETGFWETLQERVAHQRPSLAAFLQSGRLLRHDGDKLVIGFAREDKFSHDNVLEPENLLVVREAAQALAGRPLQVTIESLPGPEGTAQTMPGEGTKSRQTSTTEAAQRAKSEFKQAVIDLFHATPI